MDMIKSFFLEPFVLSLVVGILLFIVCYIHFPTLFRFLKNKTLNSQKGVLEIAEKMLIKTPKEKLILRMWFVGLSIGVLAFLACWPNLILGFALGALGFLCSWVGIEKFMRSLWERRCNKVVVQMVEGLSILSNGVKVGLGLAQAMERLIKNMPGTAIAQEFQLVLNKTHLGMSLEEALSEMEKRISRQDMTMMVVSINILKETGGNIAETLAVILETIRERQKLQKKIKALTAQGTFQAMIISCVPVVILIMMCATNKKNAELMFGTALGWLALVIIVGLVLAGGIIMKKIITIKV